MAQFFLGRAGRRDHPQVVARQADPEHARCFFQRLQTGLQVGDEAALRGPLMDDLVFEAVFNPDVAMRDAARLDGTRKTLSGSELRAELGGREARALLDEMREVRLVVEVQLLRHL